MPLVDIHVIEGVFNAAEKQQMISKVTHTMVAIEGENMRGVTWVRIHDVPKMPRIFLDTTTSFSSCQAYLLL